MFWYYSLDSVDINAIWGSALFPPPYAIYAIWGENPPLMQKTIGKIIKTLIENPA